MRVGLGYIMLGDGSPQLNIVGDSEGHVSLTTLT